MIANTWAAEGQGIKPVDVYRRLANVVGRPKVQSSIGWVVSAALLAVILYSLHKQDWASVFRLIPQSPFFWLAFAASYLALPVADWIVFRRFWKLGRRAFPALVRKHVFNGLFFSYAGEGYFFAWAKRNTRLGTAVLPGIGDAAIASAIVNSVMTLVLVWLAWPIFSAVTVDVSPSALLFAIVVLTSVPLIAFVARRSLIQTSTSDMQFAAGIYTVRTIGGLCLIATAWHFAVPDAPVSSWLVLAAGRMVVSRLPFVPDKDVVLAAIASVALGNDHEVAATITLVAALTFMVHAVLAFALVPLLRSTAKWNDPARDVSEGSCAANGLQVPS